MLQNLLKSQEYVYSNSFSMSTTSQFCVHLEGKKRVARMICTLLTTDVANPERPLRLSTDLAITPTIIIIITLLTCQVCLAEGKPSTNRGHLIDN